MRFGQLYADNLHESCLTHELLVNCAQRTGETVADTYTVVRCIAAVLQRFVVFKHRSVETT